MLEIIYNNMTWVLYTEKPESSNYQISKQRFLCVHIMFGQTNSSSPILLSSDSPCWSVSELQAKSQIKHWTAWTLQGEKKKKSDLEMFATNRFGYMNLQ